MMTGGRKPRESRGLHTTEVRPPGDGDDKYRRRTNGGEDHLREGREQVRSAKKVKEADAIKVPAFTTPQRYPAWKAAVRNEITAASGRGDEAFLWAMRPESPTRKFEDSGDSAGLTASMRSLRLHSRRPPRESLVAESILLWSRRPCRIGCSKGVRSCG